MMDKESLRFHQLEPASRVNGPGLRCVLWLQGCTLGCPGCFNPETHSVTGGRISSITELANQITGLENQVQGLTISGGEPLQQARPLIGLLSRIRQESGLSVVLFTGYEWAEIQKMRLKDHLFEFVDVVIAGRYRQDRRTATGLQGSANKTFHFLTSRYQPRDFLTLPEAEVIVDEEGNLSISGIDPLVW